MIPDDMTSLSVFLPKTDVEKLETMRLPLGVTRARMARIAFEIGLRALATDPDLAAKILPDVPDRRIVRTGR